MITNGKAFRSGHSEGFVQKSHFHGRDGSNDTLIVAASSTIKFTPPTFAQFPQFKTCNKCRDWVRRLAVFVMTPGGPALDVCRKCFVEEMNREAASGVRDNFDVLFVNSFPLLPSVAGGIFANGLSGARVTEGRHYE